MPVFTGHQSTEIGDDRSVRSVKTSSAPRAVKHPARTCSARIRRHVDGYFAFTRSRRASSCPRGGPVKRAALRSRSATPGILAAGAPARRTERPIVNDLSVLGALRLLRAHASGTPRATKSPGPSSDGRAHGCGRDCTIWTWPSTRQPSTSCAPPSSPSNTSPTRASSAPSAVRRSACVLSACLL